MRMRPYIDGLLAGGRSWFRRDEAIKALDVSPEAFLAASRRAQDAGTLLHPRRGFYVIVPPQARVFGTPPVSDIIDPLMKAEGARYYVALLKAAEIHGAAHQAVMEFQVIGDKRLPEIVLGRSVIRPFFRKEWPDERLIEFRRTQAGGYCISNPALTAFDLVRYPDAAGSLDAVATVVLELAERIRAPDIPIAAASVERPIAQRLGYIFDSVGRSDLGDALLRALGGDFRWSDFDSALDPEEHEVEMSERWKLRIHRRLEADLDPEGPYLGMGG
jgi:AbiEi antitoxin C-terminal domain